MQLFYAPDINVTHELPEEEARHALRVLRLTEGDVIGLVDGKGFFYKAIICSSNPKRCFIDVIAKQERPPFWNFDLHIAVAPTKNIDRMEWLCEKSTEIGINRITFLNCRFSERREIKLSRLEKILVSAMKQSQKATLPKLTGMTDFHIFIQQPFYGRRFIAHCHEGEKTTLKQTYHPKEGALILIGPEGDFCQEEVSAATQKGFEPISLGKSRLRTETAALTAIHTIHLLNDFPFQINLY
jgi:16S rRNA (uracil1498-N3)-methyltransferase